MESVYFETTFISYLVARPARDVIVAGHHANPEELWEFKVMWEDPIVAEVHRIRVHSHFADAASLAF